MPVTLEWYDKDAKDTLYYVFEGRWTWEDLYPLFDRAQQMAHEIAPHRIDAIIDLRNTATVPPNTLTHIRGFANKQADNAGITCLVTENRFMLMMYNMARRLYPNVKQYFVIVPDMDTAHATIASARETALDASPTNLN